VSGTPSSNKVVMLFHANILSEIKPYNIQYILQAQELDNEGLVRDEW